MTKADVPHDEAISYLAATANQGAYALAQNDDGLVGTWTQAARWRSFLEVSRPFAFLTIATDLGESDIHPPLYFWLLHLWVMWTGVHPWSGPALNMAIFGAIASGVCYRLRRRSGGSACGQSDQRGRTVLGFALGMAVLNIGLYLTFVSPTHAMEPRHAAGRLALSGLRAGFRRSLVAGFVRG